MSSGSLSAAALRSRDAPSWVARVRSPAARATAGSVATALALQAILVVGGVLSARLLGPTDRGYLALLIAVPSTICQAGTLGLSLSASYFIAKDPASLGAVVSALRRPAIAQTALLTLVHGVVVVILVADKPDDFVVAAWVSLAAVPASFALEYGLAVLQGQRRFRLFNWLRVLPSLLYGACLVALLALDAGTLLSILVASLAGTIAIGGVALAASLRRRRARPAADGEPTRREIVRFGVRSYFGNVSPVEGFRLDQIFIGATLPPAALGIYVVGTAFTNLSRFIAQSIGVVASPHVASLSDPAEQFRTSWRFFSLGFALCGALTLALVLVIPAAVPLLFGDDFEDATGIAQILVVGSFFHGIRRVLTDASRGCGLPTLGSVAELASLLVFVGALLVFSPDATGVALALTVAAATGCAILVVLFLGARRSSLAGAPSPAPPRITPALRATREDRPPESRL